jgi:hypothetical protein
VKSARRLLVAAVLLGLLAPVQAAAEERYAVIISGAAGELKYAQNYDRWRLALAKLLTGKLAFPPDNVKVLSEMPLRGGQKATREIVREIFGGLRGRLQKDDLLLVVLIGHGTFDGIDAKFNLVGPDLEAEEWRAVLGPLPGRMVIVNTTAGSFPFLERLSGPERIVITATDSGSQVYETVFPEFFVQGLGEPSADFDKNKRVSILEAFAYASSRVRQWYEERGQLSTERPILDDNADGVGKEAGAPGPDGALAARTYLAGDSGDAPAADPILGELMRRRAELEDQISQLKLRKEIMPAGDYERELERLLVELARISREIRARS